MVENAVVKDANVSRAPHRDFFGCSELGLEMALACMSAHMYDSCIHLENHPSPAHRPHQVSVRREDDVGVVHEFIGIVVVGTEIQTIHQRLQWGASLRVRELASTPACAHQVLVVELACSSGADRPEPARECAWAHAADAVQACVRALRLSLVSAYVFVSVDRITNRLMSGVESGVGDAENWTTGMRVHMECVREVSSFSRSPSPNAPHLLHDVGVRGVVHAHARHASVHRASATLHQLRHATQPVHNRVQLVHLEAKRVHVRLCMHHQSSTLT